jgi:hypothetical protein
MLDNRVLIMLLREKAALSALYHVPVCAYDGVDEEIAFYMRKSDALEEIWILSFVHDLHLCVDCDDPT